MNKAMTPIRPVKDIFDNLFFFHFSHTLTLFFPHLSKNEKLQTDLW